jgi:putative glutamine amidotransferase
MPHERRPLIVVTVADTRRASEPEVAQRKNELYAEAVRRAGGRARLVDARAAAESRREAFGAMDGLLLSGGADIEPSRFGRELDGTRDVDPERDELEAEAWTAAAERGRPVLGICRGLQAINVFSGGTLIQHVEDHLTAPFGQGAAARHELRLVASTRIGALLAQAGLGSPAVVNSYHHQAVGAGDLAPGLIAVGWSDSPLGPIVEALEGSDDRWIAGVQCHPERSESTPRAFERLFSAFVEAAAGRSVGMAAVGG